MVFEFENKTPFDNSAWRWGLPSVPWGETEANLDRSVAIHFPGVPAARSGFGSQDSAWPLGKIQPFWDRSVALRFPVPNGFPGSQPERVLVDSKEWDPVRWKERRSRKAKPKSERQKDLDRFLKSTDCIPMFAPAEHPEAPAAAVDDGPPVSSSPFGVADPGFGVSSGPSVVQSTPFGVPWKPGQEAAWRSLQKELNFLRGCTRKDNKSTQVKRIFQKLEDDNQLQAGYATLKGFVLGGADLESVQRLCKKHYDDPTLRRVVWGSLIQEACLDPKVGENVILFLAAEMHRLCPGTPNQRDIASCSTAFGHAMQRPNSNQKFLLQLLDHWPPISPHASVLEEAILKFAPGFVEQLFQRFRVDATTLSMKEPYQQQQHFLELQQSKAICSLLRRSHGTLQEVSICWNWKPDAFLCFLECLQQPECKSIVKIPHLTLPSITEGQNGNNLLPTILEAFSRTLALNPRLRVCNLNAVQASSLPLGAWIRFLQKEPTMNETEFLSRKKHKYRLDHCNPTIAYSSKVRRLSFSRDWNCWRTSFCSVLSSFRLQSLSFYGHCNRTGVKYLASILKSPSTANNLRYLLVRHVEGPLTDIYQALYDTQNQTLVSFAVDQKVFPTVSEVKVCLRILEEGNSTTLLRCPAERDETVAYYLNLNRLGRGTARTATKRQMVRLVGGASQDLPKLFPARPRQLAPLSAWKKLKDMHQIGAVYGLLREAPGLWSRGIATATTSSSASGGSISVLPKFSETDHGSQATTETPNSLLRADSSTPTTTKRRLEQELQSDLNGAAWIPSNKRCRSGQTTNNLSS